MAESGVMSQHPKVKSASMPCCNSLDGKNFCASNSNLAKESFDHSNTITRVVHTAAEIGRIESAASRIHRLLKMIARGRRKVPPESSTAINISFHEKGTQLSLDKLEGAYLHGGIVGLHNIGNTCFLNSIMQCLCHTMELTDIIMHGNFPKASFSSEYKRTMTTIWFRAVKIAKKLPLSIIAAPRPEYFVKSKKAIAPIRFIETLAEHNIHFCDGQQQDAHEFLSAILTALHAEQICCMKEEVEYLHPVGVSDLDLARNRWALYQSSNCSPIADIFVGQFKSTLMCVNCGYQSCTFEPFWDCTLPIYLPQAEDCVNLTDSLAVFCDEEFMYGANQPVCSACCESQPAIKSMTFSRFPPVLVIYLQRFNPVSLTKLQIPVNVPQHLELNAFASPETLDLLDYTDIEYDLFAMSNHIGSMMEEGHYTADVKHYASNHWFHCDDHRISPCSLSKFSEKEFYTEDAYILFYRRTLTRSQRE